MKKILNEFKNIDKKIMHITRLCLRFSFVLLIFSIIIHILLQILLLFYFTLEFQSLPVVYILL